MTLEVIAWLIFCSSCSCPSASSSAPPSVSNDPRPGLVRGFSFPLPRVPERARIAAELARWPDVFPAPSPPVLRRFRASWARPARQRDTAADSCTAYNARTGSTTRFAPRPIKYHPAHVSRALQPLSRPVRRRAAFRSALLQSRRPSGAPVGQGQKGSPDRAIFGFDSGLFFIRFLGGLVADSRSGS